MNPWLGIGVFLLGAGTGALLTAIAFSGRKVRGETGIETPNNRKAA